MKLQQYRPKQTRISEQSKTDWNFKTKEGIVRTEYFCQNKIKLITMI